MGVLIWSGLRYGPASLDWSMLRQIWQRTNSMLRITMFNTFGAIVKCPYLVLNTRVCDSILARQQLQSGLACRVSLFQSERKNQGLSYEEVSLCTCAVKAHLANSLHRPTYLLATTWLATSNIVLLRFLCIVAYAMKSSRHQAIVPSLSL